MAESETGERTEAASAKRLQQARDDGDAPVSREAASLGVLAAGGLALMLTGPAAFGGLARSLSVLLADAHAMDAGQGVRVAVRAAAAAAAPALLSSALAAGLAYAVQTGGLVTPGKLRPDLKRLSPLAGLKRLFGADGLAESAKAIVKIAVVGAAMRLALGRHAAALASAPFWNMPTLLSHIAAGASEVLLAGLAVQVAVAGADVAWVRLRRSHRLRMSRFDVKQEQKESDGDPQIKARIRQLRQARARRRMLKDVARATVVVTNPSHYAVALAYDRERHAAPRVVAKGVDEMAARIRAAAAKHRIPLVVNPPLARALHKVELDRDIPPELFQAAAQIIAYVWGLQRRAERGY